jgi:uncharacterized glyoxalase superfamily protein PhnB
VLEVYDLAADDVLERGRITVWEPGHLLAFVSPEGTELRFAFEASSGGTRVSLEVRAPAGTDPSRAVVGGGNAMLTFFCRRASDPNHLSWSGRDLPRVMPVLHYADRAAAGPWLARAFGVRGWQDDAASMPEDFPIALEIAGGAIIMRGGTKGGSADDHAVYVYVYVDDLDAHFHQAEAAGATIVRGIRSYGDRNYVALDIGGHEWTFAQARPAQLES